MTPRLSRFAAACCIALAMPSAAWAQDTGAAFDASACHTDLTRAMGSRVREFRAVLFGVPKAADAPAGAVRFDREGNAWTKTGDAWRSAAEGFNGTSWSDGQMDGQAEFPARHGYLAVKKASTSELLPPLLQSARALGCKLENVCAALSASVGTPGTASVKVHTPGCVEETVPALPSCVPQEGGEAGQSAVQQLVQECAGMRQAIFDRETSVLEFIVAYDAGHRTLRQFLGLLETFTLDLRSTLLGPVWQAVRSFQALGRIPCFSAQCEQ